MPRPAPKAEAVKTAPQLLQEDPAPASFWTLPDTPLNPPGLRNAARRLSEIQMSVSLFTADRARKNSATLSALFTCRTPQDVIEIWRISAAEAVTDYADEAASLLRLQRL